MGQPTGYCLVPEGRGDPANAVHNVIIAKGERIVIDKRHRWRAIDPPPRAAPQQGRLALELWATRAALYDCLAFFSKAATRGPLEELPILLSMMAGEEKRGATVGEERYFPLERKCSRFLWKIH